MALADKTVLITYARLSSLDFLGSKFSGIVSSTVKIWYIWPWKATMVSTLIIYIECCASCGI